jgi:hypothetical protein
VVTIRALRIVAALHVKNPAFVLAFIGCGKYPADRPHTSGMFATRLTVLVGDTELLVPIVQFWVATKTISCTAAALKTKLFDIEAPLLLAENDRFGILISTLPNSLSVPVIDAAPEVDATEV